jgi:hypothetical protein
MPQRNPTTSCWPRPRGDRAAPAQPLPPHDYRFQPPGSIPALQRKQGGPRLLAGRRLLTAPTHPRPCRPPAAGLAGMVTLWLDEEWTVLEVHAELGKAVARAYAKMRQQGARRGLCCCAAVLLCCCAAVLLCCCAAVQAQRPACGPHCRSLPSPTRLMQASVTWARC